MDSAENSTPARAKGWLTPVVLLVAGLAGAGWVYAGLVPGRYFAQSHVVALFCGSLAVYLVLVGAVRLVGMRVLPWLVLLGGLLFAGHLRQLSPIDEGAHLAVIAHLAKHRNLPRVDDYASGSVVALGEGRYPGPPSVPVTENGLAGRTYQAVHPPLYYMLGAVVHALSPSDLTVRLRNLRIFGVVLLTAATWLLLRSAGLLQPRLTMGGGFVVFACAAPLVLCPGILLRCVTLGNLCLAIFLAAVLLWLRALETARPGLWDERGAGWRRGLVGGALALTHIFAYPLLAAEFLALALARRWRALAWSAGLTGLCLAPWVLLNVSRYGALTGAAVSWRLQQPIINPSGQPIPLDDLAVNSLHLFGAFWKAQEQDYQPHVVVWTNFLTTFFILGMLVVTLNWGRRGWPLAQPRDALRLVSLTALATTPLFVLAVCIVERIMILLGRYLFPLIPSLFVIQLEAVRSLPLAWRQATAHAALLATAGAWWSYFQQLLLVP